MNGLWNGMPSPVETPVSGQPWRRPRLQRLVTNPQTSQIVQRSGRYPPDHLSVTAYVNGDLCGSYFLLNVTGLGSMGQIDSAPMSAVRGMWRIVDQTAGPAQRPLSRGLAVQIPV